VLVSDPYTYRSHDTKHIAVNLSVNNILLDIRILIQVAKWKGK